MNCSIIIRAYNEEQHIGRLLEGIRHQTLDDVEVILVDSGSSDATVSIAESYGAQIVRIPSSEFTFGRSLNFGITAATREFIVIASAHVYPVYPDWLASLLQPLEDENVAFRMASSADPCLRSFRSSRSFISGTPIPASLSRKLRSATTPTPRSKKACGTRIPTMKH